MLMDLEYAIKIFLERGNEKLAGHIDDHLLNLAVCRILQALEDKELT